jgi:hypothetical protein
MVASGDTVTLLVYPRRRFLNQRLREFVDTALGLAERIQRSPSPPGDTERGRIQIPAVACDEQLD